MDKSAFGTPHRLDGWPGVANLFRDGRVFLGGQPDPESLKRLADEEGVTVVVNLRQTMELALLPFDHPSTVESLGMKYVQIPMGGMCTREMVDQFAKELDEAEGNVFLHCTTSVRVGAMWAAYLAMRQDVPVEEAIEKGKAAGMTQPVFEEMVRYVVATG